MTYVMKIWVPNSDETKYHAFCETPKVVQVLEADPNSSGFNINKTYHFENEKKASLFLHITKQIIMYQRYEDYCFTWGDYLWNNGSFRKSWNERKNRNVSEVINYYPDDNRIQELELTPESEPLRIYDGVAVLGSKCSYHFIIDENRTQWCMGWNNNDEVKYGVPGLYKRITSCDVLIKEIPDMLFGCRLLDRMEDSPELNKLNELMPGFSDYLQKKEKYPYDTLTRSYEWESAFEKWYGDCSTKCCARGKCWSRHMIDHKRMLFTNGDHCDSYRRTLNSGGSYHKFCTEFYYEVFQKYKKLVAMNNCRVRYQLEHKISK